MVFHNVGIVSDCCEELDHGVLAVGFGEEVRSQPLISCHALNSPILRYMLLVLFPSWSFGWWRLVEERKNMTHSAAGIEITHWPCFRNGM